MVRRSLAIAAVIAALTLLVPPSSAQARACQLDFQCTTTYYADSARTTVVGGLYEDCDGHRSSWGARGISATFVETPC